MKYISKILMAVLAVAALASCETYGDPEVETTAVSDLDGRWIGFAYDAADYAANPTSAEPVEYIEIWTSNTVDNASDKIWVNVARPILDESALSVYTYTIKANCDVNKLTISGQGPTVASSPYFMTTCYYYGSYAGYFLSTDNIFHEGDNMNVNGNVELNGVKTASSTATQAFFTDKMVMNISVEGEFDWVFVGKHWTGWGQDFQEETAWLDEFFGN